jgi:type II secretion system protein C
MIKRIPAWAIYVVWGIGIFLTAWYLGQSASLYVKGRLSAPRQIIYAKENAVQQVTEQPFSFYEKEITPIFGEAKPVKKEDKKDKKDDKKPKSELDVDWDGILTSNPKSILLKGTVLGRGSAIAFLTVSGKDQSVALGGKAGSFDVSAIGKSSVKFVRGNQATVISMNLDETTTTGAPTPTASPAASPIADSGEPDLASIISRQGDNIIVDRRKFNGLLKPPSRLANDLKFIPNSKDGEPYGIKVSYLKPGSFFTMIGLQSGDILVRTNNKELKSVEDSFYAYQAFRNEEHLTLEIDRGGSIIKLPLEFR